MLLYPFKHFLSMRTMVTLIIMTNALPKTEPRLRLCFHRFTPAMHYEVARITRPRTTKRRSKHTFRHTPGQRARGVQTAFRKQNTATTTTYTYVCPETFFSSTAVVCIMSCVKLLVDMRTTNSKSMTEWLYGNRSCIMAKRHIMQPIGTQPTVLQV